MKKIVIFFEDANYEVRRAGKNLTFNGYEKITYDESMQKDLSYFISNKDSRIFSGVLDYCEREKIDRLHIVRLCMPEYLLMEIQCRNNIKTKISFATEWRIVGISRAKAFSVLELLKCKEVDKVIVFSQTGKDAKGSNFISKEIYNSPKIRNVFDMLSEEIIILDKEEQRIKYGYSRDDFVVLFFGSMLFGKGLDILTNTIDILKHVKNIKFLILARANTLNFDFNYKELHHKKNVKFFDEFVSQFDMNSMYSACDCVVIPYRNTYKYGSSNILTHSCYFKKPVISSDVYPIGSTVKKYNLGITYDNSNMEKVPLILSNKIIEMKKSKQVDYGFDEYTNNIQSWEELSKLIIND